MNDNSYKENTTRELPPAILHELNFGFPKYRISLLISGLIRLFIILSIWALIFSRIGFTSVFFTGFLLAGIVFYAFLEILGIIRKLRVAYLALKEAERGIQKDYSHD